MKNRIYLKHWLALKPQNYSSNTDLYYLKVANKIDSNFNDNLTLVLSQFMSKDERVAFCCFITCYFEDIISETNIWKAFKTMYNEIYKKTLPFYITDEDYLDEEINFEDIAFLTWYYLNTIQNNKFISPYTDFIFEVATLTMEVLIEEYEFAPENNSLKKIFRLENNSVEFYDTRIFMQTVFFEAYLFNPDLKYKLDKESVKIIEENKHKNPDFILSMIREITEYYTFNKTSSLLALNAKDWSKNVLGKTHKNYNVFDTISEKITGLFLYVKQNTDSVFIEHIASSMVFEITKKSFDHYNELKKDDIIYIGLVKFKNEWWFSGNFSVQEFNADIILDQKNSGKARADVTFLEDQKELKSLLKEQEIAFLKYNKERPIAYMKAKDIQKFSNNFITFYNETLNLSENRKEQAFKRLKGDGFFNTNDNFENSYDDVDEAIVFFNPKSGLEIYFDILNAFPDKNNSFFTNESKDDILRLLISPDYSLELVQYLLGSFKNKLDFFKNDPYKSCLEDLDFLLRFWKTDDYKTTSKMILTGKSK